MTMSLRWVRWLACCQVFQRMGWYQCIWPPAGAETVEVGRVRGEAADGGRR